MRSGDGNKEEKEYQIKRREGFGAQGRREGTGHARTERLKRERETMRGKEGSHTICFYIAEETTRTFESQNTQAISFV